MVRRLANALVYAVVLALVLIGLGIGTLETPWGRNQLRRLVVRQANRYLTASLEIDRLEGSLFSGLDRACGAMFGLLRGLVMVGLFVIFCHAVRLEGEPWWRGSLLVPYAEHAANVLRGMVGERKMVT